MKKENLIEDSKLNHDVKQDTAFVAKPKLLAKNTNFKKGITMWEILIAIVLATVLIVLTIQFFSEKSDDSKTSYNITMGLSNLQESLPKFKEFNLTSNDDYTGITNTTFFPYLDSNIWEVNGTWIQLRKVREIKFQVIASRTSTNVNNGTVKILFNGGELGTNKGYQANELTELENVVGRFFKQATADSCIVNLDATAIGSANVNTTSDESIGTPDGILLIDRAVN